MWVLTYYFWCPIFKPAPPSSTHTRTKTHKENSIIIQRVVSALNVPAMLINPIKQAKVLATKAQLMLEKKHWSNNRLDTAIKKGVTTFFSTFCQALMKF